MSHSDGDNDNNKKVSGLLVTRYVGFSKEIGLPIYNINDLTDGELKFLIQNFFESEDGYEDPDKYYKKKNIFIFTFKDKEYHVKLIGGENDSKKSIIKFLNFLKNMMIDEFYCYDFDYDVDIINLIGNVIKNSEIIKNIHLTNNFFKNDHVLEILSEYLKYHKSLRGLYFGYSSIDKLSDKHVGILVNVIKFSIIEDVGRLHKNDYNLIFEDLMNNSMSKNHKIKCVGRCLNDDRVLKLSNMIIDNNINYLEEIDFTFNNITSKGFSILVDSLLKSNNKDIIKIDISDNKLDDDCIEKLSELINQNKNISCIDIISNQITDKGVEILSEYVIGNTFIKSIDLDYNLGITDSSYEIIKNMVKYSSISSFKIYGTQISEKLEDEIKELLKIPIEQREIPLITIEDVKSASKRMKE